MVKETFLCTAPSSVVHYPSYTQIYNMTIIQLINGEKVNFLQVNVLKQINLTQFIVGDNTGLAIMTLEGDQTQNVEVGKGLKMVKPSIQEKVISCHPKFSPMKSKQMKIEVNQEELDQLELSGTIKNRCTRGVNFSQIQNDFGDTAVINSVLVYVTTKSKHIDGKYGSYQICNLKDLEGSSSSINLYKQNIDKLEVNKMYTLEKIKKTTIRTDSGIRMATTNFTNIKAATPDQIHLFDDIEIADYKIAGTCLMFNELSYYKSCKKHLTKLDGEGCCSNCGQNENDVGKVDFRCSLIIENKSDETMTAIVIFKRHLDVELNDDDDNEAKLIELLEDKIVGKQLQIFYNATGFENNVAIKVIITE